MRETSPTHALFGGSVMLSYQLIREWLVHHDHTNLRPKFIDHLIATTIVGGIAFMLFNNGGLRNLASGCIFSFCTVAPMTWWLKMNGARPQAHLDRSPNVFYLNDTTPEEIERIRHQDMVESLAYQMNSQPGFGLVGRDARYV